MCVHFLFVNYTQRALLHYYIRNVYIVQYAIKIQQSNNNIITCQYQVVHLDYAVERLEVGIYKQSENGIFKNCKCTCKIGLVWIGGGEMGSVITFVLALFMITCYY